MVQSLPGKTVAPNVWRLALSIKCNSQLLTKLCEAIAKHKQRIYPPNSSGMSSSNSPSPRNPTGPSSIHTRSARPQRFPILALGLGISVSVYAFLCKKGAESPGATLSNPPHTSSVRHIQAAYQKSEAMDPRARGKLNEQGRLQGKDAAVAHSVYD